METEMVEPWQRVALSTGNQRHEMLKKGNKDLIQLIP